MVWPEHLGQPRHTLNYRRNLVMTLAVQDKDVEAEAEAREIVKITDKSLGSERQNWLATYLAPSWISRESTKRQKFKSDRRCA